MTRITTAWIKGQKRAAYSNDIIYATAAGLIGLYHIAFFGHKATKYERQKLTTIWKRILKTTA